MSTAEVREDIKRSEPDNKRAVVFIQADVLWQEAKRTFNINRLDVIPSELAKSLCDKNGWELTGIYVYVSRQSEEVNEKWYNIWNRIMRLWQNEYNLDVYCSPWSVKWLNVVNHHQVPDLRDIYTAPVYVADRARNKMICDVVSMAHYGEFDVAVLVTKDQDLQPLADEIRDISIKKQVWLKVANAFPFEKPPVNEKPRNFRGIDQTDWIHIDYDMYNNACFREGASGEDSTSDN